MLKLNWRRPIFLLHFVMLLGYYSLRAQQQPQHEWDHFRPNLEMYRTDKVVSQGDASYSGDLNLSVPLLVIPGKHGHDFPIVLTYNSNITQRQTASWVGLGWNLELGSVERSPMGRFDEQIAFGTNRYQLNGWFQYTNTLQNITQQDQADLYTLNVDGSSEELLPFGSGLFREYNFTPVRYKPQWVLKGFGDAAPYNLGIVEFDLTKEDGSKYTFQKKGFMRLHEDNNITFTYANRWPLTSINYPDGAATSIFYIESDPNAPIQDKYAAVLVQRNSNEGSPGLNIFGAVGDLWPAGDPNGTVSYQYSYPREIETDTHYAIFSWSLPAQVNSGGDAWDRYERTNVNAKLDSIILYDKATKTELKRVKFFYAGSNNDKPYPYHHFEGSAVDTTPWNGERLNNNQLTLVQVQILNEMNPGDPNSQIPPYKFTYYHNPKVEWLYQMKYSAEKDGNNQLTHPYFPGYHTDPDFATVWRLKGLTLPSGAKITYTYQRLENGQVNPTPFNENDFIVVYTPQGTDYRLVDLPNYYSTARPEFPWSYKAQPRCRLLTKTVTDPLGPTQQWTYSYGPAIYDPPSRLAGMNYFPSFYIVQGFYEQEYYNYFRGCNIGHRWVMVTNPDGSWVKNYFTSSYQRPDSDLKEKMPDVFDSQGRNTDAANAGVEILTMESNAAKRGLVWKTETPTDSILNNYTFVAKDNITERVEYFNWLAGPGNLDHSIKEFSYWVRLDRIDTWKDGIYSINRFDYYPEVRDSLFSNLLWHQSEGDYNFPKTTEYEYAASQHPGMVSKGMASQIYSLKVRNDAAAISIWKKTTWALFNNNLWLPKEEWELGTSAGDIRVLLYDAYDAFGNLLQTTSADSIKTKYYYGTNTSQFTNSGLSYSYLTGMDRNWDLDGGQTLRTGLKYDRYGNIIEKTDENGNATAYQYDNLGRLTAIVAPGGSTTNQFSYSYAGSAISPSNPNLITAKNYSTTSTYSENRLYYDGTGYEIQRQTKLANLTTDIISATVRDRMKRDSLIYKAYQPSTWDHTYDSQFAQNAGYFYSPLSIDLPYARAEYTIDGRPLHQHAPGSTFQNEGAGRYLKYTYGTNAANEIVTNLNQLYKTAVVDENGKKTMEYKDRLGNIVATVVDSAGLQLTTKFEYDMAGRKTKVTTHNNLVSTYTYDTRGLLTQKATPDGGTTQYLYDKNGNLRFSKDANHSGVGVGVNINDDRFITATNPLGTTTVRTGTFSLMGWQRVVYTIQMPNPNQSANQYMTLKIKTSGGIVLDSLQMLSAFPQGIVSKSLTLPPGTYTYDEIMYDDGFNGEFIFSISSAGGYEFIYNKYDALNRLIETGEYESGGGGSFTQANADNSIFPNGQLKTYVYGYDSLSSNGIASTQRNVIGKLASEISYRAGVVALIKYYSYDAMGRVEWVIFYDPTTVAKKIEYTYDLQGKITVETYKDPLATNFYQCSYSYDQADRLFEARSSIPGGGSQRDAWYSYNPTGAVRQLKLGQTGGEVATLDYTYNSRDWLKTISSNKLSMTFGYNESVPTGLTYAPPQFNGNINWLTYNLAGVTYSGPQGTTANLGYSFNYDGANRLDSANFGYNVSGFWYPTNAYSERNLQYDQLGNILGLLRYGSTGLDLLQITSRNPAETLHEANQIIVDGTYVIPSGSSETFEAKNIIRWRPGFKASAGSIIRAHVDPNAVFAASKMDELTYHYNAGSNKLQYVTDAVSSTAYAGDLDSQPSNNYAYDGNGNMIQDLEKGIGYVLYDINNLPIRVCKTNGDVIDYIYDSRGERAKKIAANFSTWYINGVGSKTSFIKTSNINDSYTVNLYGNDAIGQARVVGGVPIRYYYLKDHLGSIRATINGTDGSVASYDDYYPFGMVMDNRSASFGNPDTRYKFTGKERDIETGYDYFGARYYDSRIGRWLSVDPLAEKYPGWSTYNYVANNPLKYFDSDGRGINLGNEMRERFKNPIGYAFNQIAENVHASAKAFVRGNISGGLGYYGAAVLNTLALPFDVLDPSGTAMIYSPAVVLAEGSQGARALSGLANSVRNIEAGEELGMARSIFQKIDNTITTHLKLEDITGAASDLAGKPITIGGKTYQHLKEVQDAQNGLANQISKLKNLLGNKDLSQEARKLIEQKLGATSKFLDETEKSVPRQ